MHVQAQEPLPLESWNLQYGHPCYTLSLSEPCPRVEKNYFKEIYQFHTFYPKITSHCRGGGMDLQSLVPLSYRRYIPNLVILAKQFLRRGCKCTTDDRRRSIGYLSDSGDLKIYTVAKFLYPWFYLSSGDRLLKISHRTCKGSLRPFFIWSNTPL